MACTTPSQFESRVRILRVPDLKPETRQQLANLGERLLGLPASMAEARHPYDTGAYVPWIRTLVSVFRLAPERQAMLAATLGEGLDAAMQLSVADPQRYPLDPLTDLDRQFVTLYVLGAEVPGPLRDPWQARVNALESRVSERAGEIPAYTAAWAKTAREVRAKNDVPQPAVKKRIDEFMEALVTVGGARGFEKGTDGTWKYAYGADGEAEPSSWRVERFDAHESFVVLRRTDPADGNVVVTVQVDELLKAAEDGSVDFLIERGLKSAESEAAGRELMEGYDLPADRRTAHIRLFPRERYRGDPVTKSLFASAMLATALKQRYGDRVSTQQPVFTDNPGNDLELAVAGAHEEGARHFLIDLVAHGTPEGIRFNSMANPDAALRARDIVDLAKRYADSTFTINTIACFGGGLVEEFLRIADDDVKARVTIFTQTKGDTPNSTMDRAPQPDTRGYSDYTFGASGSYIELINNLPGNTYGGAARRADTDTKMYGTDGDAVIGGTRIGRGRRPRGQPDVT